MDQERLKAKALEFRQLHQGPGVLVLANAWDVATARVLVDAGAPAVATSSAGIAFSLGYPDGQVIPAQEMLIAVGRIAGAVDVPVSADLEAGYGERPEELAETVRHVLDAGVIGANIEDAKSESGNPLFDQSLAAERIRAAREAADGRGIHFVINARTDACLRSGVDRQTLDESIRRANAYREVGADCLFVPGVSTRDAIRELVEAIDGPLNILARLDSPPLTELREMGVRRVSLGSGLMRATLALVRRALGELRASGTYEFLRDAPGVDEINRLLR